MDLPFLGKVAAEGKTVAVLRTAVEVAYMAPDNCCFNRDRFYRIPLPCDRFFALTPNSEAKSRQTPFRHSPPTSDFSCRLVLHEKMHLFFGDDFESKAFV